MTLFIDEHRDRFAVAEICRVLGWCTSTYYAHRRRPPSNRALRDEQLKTAIWRVWDVNYRVYGYRKIHAQLQREGVEVAECTVRRLMRDLDIQGAMRGWKGPRTTRSDDAADRPPDLLDRDFTAAAPDRVWVADITYVRLLSGVFVYAALVADVFSRKIIGWAVADHLRTELPEAALRHALSVRHGADVAGVTHHSDAGCQYTSLHYGLLLVDAGIVPSIGSVGDSYDNALAESTIGLVKTELVHNPHQGPWRSRDQFELALAEYVDWFNNARLHGELGHITPTEQEARYYRQTAPAPLAGIQS